MKKLIFFILAFFLVLLFVEVGSFAYLRSIKAEINEGFSDEKKLKTVAFDRFWNLDYKAHPFFGFVKDDKFDGVFSNNYNFHSVFSFPYIKGKEEIVIGVFGGSVAEGVGSRLEREERWGDKLKNHSDSQFSNKKITFLNFAMGGYRQPQSFFVMAYFIDTIDIFVFLEGANEISANPYPNYPYDFPKLNRRFFDDPDSDFWKKQTLSKLTSVLGSVGQLYISSRSVFRSSFLDLSWRVTYRFGRDFLAGLSDEIVGNNSKSPTRYYPKLLSSDELDKGLVNTWGKYVALSKALADSQKKLVFHFLQPSPHSQKKKKLSPEERKIFDKGSHWYKKFAERLVLLRDKSKSLKQQGYTTIDLTDIFLNEKETIYTDAFCHINTRGEDILIQHILDEVYRGHRQQ